MKTTFYTRTLIAIIAMLLITLNVFSQAPPTTTIPSLTCQEGIVIVPVTVTNFNGIGNISLRINYDPAILTYQSVVVNSSIPVGNTFYTIAPDATGQFRLSYSGSIGAPGITLPDGVELFTLTFAVKAGVTSVTTPITWSTLQKDCEYTPPSPGNFTPEITPGNLSTYFNNGSIAIKPLPVITGPNSVCPLSTVTYITQAGMSNYSWNVSAGGTITAGGTSNTLTVSWGNISSQTVSVNFLDPTSACTATIPTVYPVNISNSISPTLTGPNSVCIGTSGMIYTTDLGMTNYLWSIIGGTITAGGGTANNTATVTWNTSGPQSITVDYIPSGSCTSIPTTYTVNVIPTVGIPTITAGNEPSCQLANSTTTTVYTATAANNSGFIWSIDNPLAGSINALTGVMTWTNGFAGTVSIQVTANGCTPTVSTHIVNIIPTVSTPTAITISAGTEPTCQLANTNTTTYATTAANSTGFNWSLSNAAAGTIDPSTGVMTWAVGFTGTIDIRVTANGCNGPSLQVIRTVNITPSVGIPTAITLSSGLEPTCQLTIATTTTTYSTTATNSTGFNWTLSNPSAGTINPTTGLMTWAIGFSGSVNIQVTANGCNSPSLQVIRTVTITPGAGTPTVITVSAGSEPTCQLTNAITTTTYATTATNSLSFSWSINNTAAGFISPTTGVMTWANGFAGSVDIQVTANGCNGSSAQVIRTVSVVPNVGTLTPITISAGAEPTCQLANATITTTYATSATGNSGFNWSISNPAAGIIDPSTGVMTWNNGFAGSVDIRVIANGCNGQSPQVIRTITITPTVGTPSPIIISDGTEPTCQLTDVTTITTYSTTATNNTGFIWSISNPAAGTINTTTGAMLWKYGFTGSVDIQVSANGCNGPSTQVIRTVVITPNVTVPVFTIGASSARCQGAGTVVYSATANNSTGITYSLDANSASAGNTISSTTGAVTFTAGWIGVTTITATATGCNGPTSAFHTVTINPLPIPTLTGPASICINSSGNVYTTEPGMINYIWSVSAGGTITDGGTTNRNTATVTWNTSGPQTVRVIYTNETGCNAASAALYPVSVNPTPSPTISGPSSVCFNSTSNVYTTEAGMSNYAWNVSTGGTITAGGTSTSNSVTITWNTQGAQNVSVNYTNGNGCSATSAVVYPVTVASLVSPTLNGSNTVCVGTSGIVYTTESGMTQYNWNISSGGTITSGGTLTDNTVTVSWNTEGAQSVSVDYIPSGGCASIPTVLPVTVNPLPTPTITGPATICVNTIGNVYTTQVGMSNYTWNVSAGGTITSGGMLTDNTITLTWNTAGPQTVSVNYASVSGCQSVNPTPLNVSVNSIPDPAGNITGSAKVNYGATGVAYSIASIPNTTSYTWSIPAGATIASGDGTNSITVNFASNATAGNINVYGTNACGTGIASSPFAIAFNALPAIPENITGPGTVCQSAIGITYTVTLINNATGYVWTIPSGTTITSGDNTNSITVNYGMNAVSGNVTVYGTNESGNGPVSPPLAVTTNPLPISPIITVDAASGVILTSNTTTGNQWYDDKGLIVGATNQTYTATNNGTFFVGVTGICTFDKSNTIIVTRVSINASDKQIFGVYPNPNTGGFWIEYKSSENEKLKMIQVLDLLGKPIYQLLQDKPTSDYKEWVNIKNHPIGVYILVLTTENHKLSRRLVITR